MSPSSKKQRVMLGCLCNQTDTKTLYYGLLKLKYYGPIRLKHQKDENKYAPLNSSYRNHTNSQDFYQKIFKLINRSLCPTGRL